MVRHAFAQPCATAHQPQLSNRTAQRPTNTFQKINFGYFDLLNSIHVLQLSNRPINQKEIKELTVDFSVERSRNIFQKSPIGR
ncbi:MAG: hypothetical protein ABJB16_18415 [Saprospiraceae bacterium]